MIPLPMAPFETDLEIRKVAADEAVKKQLRHLGILEGGILRLLRSGKGVVVQIKDGRLALDAFLASGIFVERRRS